MMGYIFSSATKMPNLLKTLLVKLLVAEHSLNNFVASIYTVLLSQGNYSFLKINRQSDRSYQNYDHEEQENRPSPLLVPVPMTSQDVSELMVKKLPVVKFMRMSNTINNKDGECAICLKKIEEREEIRELGNCSHYFHMECLDAWVDEGQHLTCPLCRQNLLPPPDHAYDDDDVKGKYKFNGKDPWRMERMFYIFGEDIEFS